MLQGVRRTGRAVRQGRSGRHCLAGQGRVEQGGRAGAKPTQDTKFCKTLKKEAGGSPPAGVVVTTKSNCATAARVKFA